MFILYPLLIAIALAALTGGRPGRLADLRLRWWWLAVAGLLVQVALFSPAAAGIASIGPVVYVVSTSAVLVTVLANLRRPGVALVAMGALLNLAAIVANGGYMPTTPAALRSAGLDPARGYSNSVELEQPAGAAHRRLCDPGRGAVRKRLLGRRRLHRPWGRLARVLDHASALRRCRRKSSPSDNRGVLASHWPNCDPAIGCRQRRRTPPTCTSPRANPPRDGDAKPGILLARPPGCRDRVRPPVLGGLT